MKWFKHDSNALHDAKIEKLIMKYGIEGYGLYFACVEMIAEKLSVENMSFELEHDAELLSHKFKIDSKRTEEMMKYCIALNLFQYSAESNKIFCQALSRRVDNTTAQHPQFKVLLENMKTKKLESNLSSFKQLQETCPIVEQSRVKKKRKKNNNEPAAPSGEVTVPVVNRPVYHLILDTFTSKNTDFNFKREGPHVKVIEEKANDRDDPEGFAKAVLVTFWRLIHSQDKFWRGQPFLPSVLNAGGIWPRVLKELENAQTDAMSPEVQEIVKGLWK